MGKKRHDESKASVHYVSQLQVLATDIPFTSPSILLSFDRERYLFNAGEGIQRIFREFKLRIAKVDHILFSRIATETMAGLPGMILSADSSSTASDLLGSKVGFTLHGPPGVAPYTEAFRSYVHNSHQFTVKEFGVDAALKQQPIIKSGVVTITPVPVHPSVAVATTAEGGTSSPPQDHGANGTPDKKRKADDVPLAPREEVVAGAAAGHTRRPAGNSSEASRAAAAPSVCYMCELAGRPGKFDSAKAEALEIPIGPLRGELVRGKAVPNLAGRLVQPEEVMSPGQPGPLVAVVDLPSEAHVAAAQERDVFRPWAVALGESAGASTSGAPPQVRVMIHMGTGATLVQGSTAYRQWMEALAAPAGGGWQHLVVPTGSTQATAIPRATALQVYLNCLSDTVFPLLHSNLRTTIKLPPPADAAPPTGDASSSGAAAPQTGDASSIGDAAPPTGDALSSGAVAPQTGDASSIGDAAPPMGDASSSGAAAPQTGDVSSSGAAAPPTGDTSSSGAVDRQILVVPSCLQYNLTQTTKRQCGVCMSSVATHREDPDAAAAAGDVNALAAAFKEKYPAVMALVPPAGGGTAEGDAGGTDDVPPEVKGADRRTVELTFLGTVSSQPSKFRNVSGVYVDLFDGGGMMVDCGEDSLGQLVRRYGEAEALRRVLSLQAVWVSHMHADHHGGLYRVLELRYRLLGPSATPLTIMGPFPLLKVLSAYSRAVPMSFCFIPNAHFHHRATGHPTRPLPPVPAAAYERIKASMKLKRLEPFEVDHVANSSGLLLEGQAGWKFVFSGDTRPCESVVEAAQGATLLVHEATFEDEMQEEAASKKHSTTGEALAVAERAGAYRTVLTHFSTRYPKLPVMPGSGDGDAGATVADAAVAKATAADTVVADVTVAGATGADATAANAVVTNATATDATAADATMTDSGVADATTVEATATDGTATKATAADATAVSDYYVGHMAVAMDFMVVNLVDLPWLPRLMAPLGALFDAQEEAWSAEEEEEAVAV